MEADRLAGDVDGRRRGHVQDSLGRRAAVPVRHGARRAGGRPGVGGVAGGQVSGLRDGAMSLALLDERLVGGTGTAMGETW